jgi:CRP-like cAMP-binding protein
MDERPTIQLFRHQEGAKDYAPGDVIFKEGDPGDHMYAVQSGEVEIRLRGKPVEILREGDIFGELALVDDRPRAATAIAKTACKLVPVDEKRFTFLVEEAPFFAVQVMRIMAHRIRRMLETAF